MNRVFVLLLLSTLFVSCKEERYPYEISDFRYQLRPHLKSLSEEHSLPSYDTVARNFITKHATKDELIRLMNSKFPILRIIAYRTIVNREEPEYYELLINHLSDTARVRWWYYDDVVDDCQISDMMIRKAFDRNGLSPIHKKHLVEKVLLEHPYLDISTWMIQDIDPNPKYYSVIRKKAIKKTRYCNDQLIACYALSKFQKEKDVQLLYNILQVSLEESECFEWVFRTIENFPDPKFYVLLENYFHSHIKGKMSVEKSFKHENEYFTRAIAAYKNRNALEILQYIEQNNTYIHEGNWPPSNKEYVYKAALIHYDSIYDPFINKVEKEFNKEDIEYIRHSSNGLISIYEKKYW